MSRHWLIASCLVFCAACAAEELGSPPSISDLSYSPRSITTGQAATIQGTLRFEDADADLLEMLVTLRAPGDERMELPATEVADAEGKTEGLVALQLVLIAPTPGEYAFEIRLIDANGNESNAHVGSVVAL